MFLSFEISRQTDSCRARIHLKMFCKCILYILGFVLCGWNGFSVPSVLARMRSWGIIYSNVDNATVQSFKSEEMEPENSEEENANL